MMLNNEFMRQLMVTFAIEAKEQIQAINKHLLALEKEPDPKSKKWLWQEIFREAHSLKGASRAVNLPKVNDLAHGLESLFGQLQEHKLDTTAEIFDLIYRALDMVERLVDLASNGTTDQEELDITPLLAELEAAMMNKPVTTMLSAPTDEVVRSTSTREANGQKNRSHNAQSNDQRPSHARRRRDAGTERDDDGRQKRKRDDRHRNSQANGLSSTQALGSRPPIYQPVVARSVSSHNTKQKPHEMVPSLTDETIRVKTNKLDALMAQVSELQMMRIGTEQRIVELSDTLSQVEVWEREWRKMQSRHRRLLYQEEKPLTHSAGPGDQDASAKPLLHFLMTNEKHLKETRSQLHQLQQKLKADHHQIRQALTGLQEDVRRTRMEPVATLFDSFSRMVRDLARTQSKKVDLIIEGRETEVDRTLIQQMKAPLVHLLRNAIDHGLETSEERQALGKAEQGQVILSATQQGHNIVIQVRDNGRGILPDKVRASAIKKGIVSPENAKQMDDEEALWLIFGSGFSTSAIITDVSGRGVGLDVVRESIERMQGMIEVASVPNQGTSFTITWPLTVAATPALLVRATGQTFAIPITNVARIVHFKPQEVRQAEGHRIIRVDGRPVPLVPLAEVLGLGLPVTLSSVEPPAVVLGAAERRVAVLIDDLIGTQDIVIKSLPTPFLRIKHIAGATILGTGEVVNILHVADLIRTVKWPLTLSNRSSNGHKNTGFVVQRKRPPRAQQSIQILVADDSMTTRMMEKKLLETAGYQVDVAVDGKQALRELQRGSYDLLVSDVEMPHINGFDLTAQIRQDEWLKKMPVILVTSLNSPADRQRGIDVGADAYIAKGSFEENYLLDTVKRLLG